MATSQCLGLIHFLLYFTFQTSLTEYSTFNCNYSPLVIESGFRAPNGDLYFFTDDFLSKVRSFENGKWFRIEKNYPKHWKQWIAEDFRSNVRLYFYCSIGEEVQFYQTLQMNPTRLFVFRWNSLSERYEFQEEKTMETNKSHILRSCVRIKDIVSKDGNKYRRRNHFTDKTRQNECSEIITEYEISENGETNKKSEILVRNCPSPPIGTIITSDTQRGSVGYSTQDQWSIPLYIEPRKHYEVSTTFTILQTNFTDRVNVDYNNQVFPDINVNARLVIPNKLWFGCPEFNCMLAFIDAATKFKAKMLWLFSGRYLFETYSINDGPNTGKLIDEYLPKTIPYFIDAAFTDRNHQTTFIVKENSIWTVKWDQNIMNWIATSPTTIDTLFIGCNNVVENIHFDETSNSVYLFFGGNYSGVVWRYTTITNSSRIGLPDSSIWVTDINKNLPQVTDAVFKDPNGEDTIMVKNNFGIRISKDQTFGEPSDHQMEYRSYFGCSPSQYDPFFKEVNRYEQMTRPPTFTATGSPPPLPTIYISSPKLSTLDSTRNDTYLESQSGVSVTVIIIAIVALVGILFIAPAFSYYNLHSKARKKSSKKTLSTITLSDRSGSSEVSSQRSNLLHFSKHPSDDKDSLKTIDSNVINDKLVKMESRKSKEKLRAKKANKQTRRLKTSKKSKLN